MKQTDIVYRRNPGLQLLNLFLLFPFAAGIRALRVKHTNTDLFVFLLGFLVVLTLILINNLRPYVRIQKKKILLYLLYSFRPEEHPFELLLGYKIKGKTGIVLFSYDHNPVIIRLRKKDRNNLLEILKNKAIYEIHKIS